MVPATYLIGFVKKGIVVRVMQILKHFRTDDRVMRQLCAVEWYTVENNRYSRKYYSYYSSKYNFVLLFPSRWQGVVSAVLNTQDNEIVFISYDPEKKFTVDKTTELMRIRTIAKDDTEALVNSKDYRMIGESDESIICIKETTGYLTGKLALTESELQNSLIVL